VGLDFGAVYKMLNLEGLSAATHIIVCRLQSLHEAGADAVLWSENMKTSIHEMIKIWHGSI